MSKDQQAVLRVLGGIGNANILRSHIRVLEDRISKKQDCGQLRSVQDDTDLYSWYVLFGLYFSNRLEQLVFRKKNSDSRTIKELFKEMKKLARKDDNDFAEADVELLRQLRDSIAHFGLPNLVRSENRLPASDRQKLTEHLNDFSQARAFFKRSEDLLNTYKESLDLKAVHFKGSEA
jgi:hypothetical protein